MADDSKVIVTLKLLGGASFAKAAKDAGLELKTIGISGDAAAAGLNRTSRASTVAQSRLGRIHRTSGIVTGALQSMAGMIGFTGVAFAAVRAGRSFIDFQRQMMMLETQTGATHREMQRATKGILDMAVSVGTGPQSLSEAMYHIESAGYRGRKGLAVLRAAALGAKVGNANLVDVTNALTSTVVAGMSDVKNYGQAMGMLNATVGAGDMTMQDLADAMHGTAVVASSAGLDLKDLGAVLAVLGDNNIRGAKAAMGLSMGLRVLMGDSKVTAAAQHELGLKQNELVNTLRKPDGLLKMLDLLHVKLKDKTPAQEATSIMQIFGARSGVGMLILYRQMERLRQKYEEVGKGGRRFRSDVDKTGKTLGFLADQAKAAAEVGLVKLGSKLQDVVKWIKENKKTINDLLPGLKVVGIAIAATFAVNRIAAFGAAIMGLMTPIGIITAGLVGAIAAYEVLHKDIVMPAGSTPQQVADRLRKMGLGFAIPEIVPKLNRKGAFPNANSESGTVGPPILPAPKKNIAMATPAAPLYANVVLKLENGVLHRGVYKFERRLAES